jgi:D-glycero-D-manno-heptose 1,7-bisphosphate phosphatase
MNKAIFLDRDGVLNVAVLGKYVNCADDLTVFPFAGSAISIFNELGYKCYVITNQSGIAKGHFGLSALCEIHMKMSREIKAVGGKIERFYTCPHNPDDPMCECRKPKPGNILTCAKENDIDLSKSFMVGDAPSDIEAGRAAGCHTVAVLSGYIEDEKLLASMPELVFEDVYRFAINLKNETEIDTLYGG